MLDLPASVTLLAGCAAPDAVSRPSETQAACFDLTHLPFEGWYFVYTLPRSFPLPRKCNVQRQSSGLGSPVVAPAKTTSDTAGATTARQGRSGPVFTLSHSFPNKV